MERVSSPHLLTPPTPPNQGVAPLPLTVVRHCAEDDASPENGRQVDPSCERCLPSTAFNRTRNLDYSGCVSDLRQSRRLEEGGATQSRTALWANVRPHRFQTPSSALPQSAPEVFCGSPVSIPFASFPEPAPFINTSKDHTISPFPTLPELSNSGSLSGRAGGFPVGLKGVQKRTSIDRRASNLTFDHWLIAR